MCFLIGATGPGVTSTGEEPGEGKGVLVGWKMFRDVQRCGTVDGSEILQQLRLVVFPIIYRVSYIPGGGGFQPSTVGGVLCFFL